VIPIAVTLLWFPLIGMAISRAIGRVPPFLGGVAGTGIALFVLSVSGVPFGWGIGIAGATAAAAIIRRRDRWGWPWQRPDAAALIILVPVAVLLFAVSFFPQHDYDGTAFWMLKAKAIAAEDAVDGPFFRGENTFSPRNEYPLLLPLDVAAVMKMSGRIDDEKMRWIFPLILGSFALELRRRFRAWSSPTVATVCAALLGWTPQFAIEPQGGAMSSYADVALAAFIAMALLELVDAASPLRLGFWIAALALTKSEGLPLALLFLVVGVVVFRRRVVAALPLPGIAIISLLVWRSRIEPTDEGDLFGRLTTLLPSRTASLPGAAFDFLRYALEWRTWGVFWLLTAVALIVLLYRREWRTLALAGSIMLGMLTLYSAVYVVTDFVRAELLRVTAARLLMHFAGPALYLASVAGARKVDVPQLDADTE
jgi:hypothetical protein